MWVVPGCYASSFATTRLGGASPDRTADDWFLLWWTNLVVCHISLESSKLQLDKAMTTLPSTNMVYIVWDWTNLKTTELSISLFCFRVFFYFNRKWFYMYIILMTCQEPTLSIHICTNLSFASTNSDSAWLSSLSCRNFYEFFISDASDRPFQLPSLFHRNNPL